MGQIGAEFIKIDKKNETRFANRFREICALVS